MIVSGSFANFQEVAKTIDPKQQQLTTTIPLFDAFLRGGLQIGYHTQFFGEAGSGKSQIAMQLLLGGCLNQEKVSNLSILLTLQKDVSLQRFQDFQRAFFNSKHQHPSVKVFHCRSLGQFLEYFEQAKEMVASGHSRLIVIDPICKLIDWDNSIDGKVTLKKVKSDIRSLLFNYSCAVVTINNVTDDFFKGGLQSRLGINWSFDLNCQYMVWRCKKTGRRWLMRRLDPFGKHPQKIRFELREQGIWMSELQD